MKQLLIEIGHPAHVHFFKHPIRILEEQGWNVIIHAIDKAETFELLRAEGLQFYHASRRPSAIKNATHILPVARQIYHIVKKHEIDIMSAISGVHSSLASRLSGVPFVCFTDTEHAIEQSIFYRPTSRAIHSPRAFRKNFGKKHFKYPGYHELSYLHPNRFKPDQSFIEDTGVLDNGPPILLRMVDWSASHDFGVAHEEWERDFVKNMMNEYRVLISVEGKIPRGLEKYRNPLPACRLHDLLAFCRVYVGAGATTASESAMLGTPAVYTNPLKLGYIQELET
ncbi:DUF354 domain-containing protein, partial [Candidatus Babeliales bacterium]|nr:DUF354 domain-containing protein [Candidatus Babeliales bacterium]